MHIYVRPLAAPPPHGWGSFKIIDFPLVLQYILEKHMIFQWKFNTFHQFRLRSPNGTPRPPLWCSGLQKSMLFLKNFNTF